MEKNSSPTLWVFLIWFGVLMLSCQEDDPINSDNLIDTLFVTIYDTIIVIDSSASGDDPIIRPGASPDNFIESFRVPHAGSFIDGFIDSETNSILFHAPNNMNIESLAPIISISDSAVVSPASGQVVDLFDGEVYTVTAANGMELNYNVGFYSSNLLYNPSGANNGEGWVVGVNCGTEIINDTDTVFYGFKDQRYGVRISQEVSFSRDYSSKYVLLIGDLWTDSITEKGAGHPYLWAQQRGDFTDEDWPFLQGMVHRADANKWEVVYGVHELLKNVTSLDLWLKQSSVSGDELLGARNRFDDVEMRVFNSINDADLYVQELYEKSY